MPNRRLFLHRAALATLPLSLWPMATGTRAAAAEIAATQLRNPGAGLVVAIRHALAPGTFDPPGFRAGECSTQRNLSDEGRAQARRLGVWFRERGFEPAGVRSSEWCRCLETARLAFGAATPWPALNSLVGDRSRQAEHAAAMRAELARLARAGRSGFEVWVTHQVNITALAGQFAASGEGVLLRDDGSGNAPVVLARLQIDA